MAWILTLMGECDPIISYINREKTADLPQIFYRSSTNLPQIFHRLPVDRMVEMGHNPKSGSDCLSAQWKLRLVYGARARVVFLGSSHGKWTVGGSHI
jgi:hypothetical protein